ncbi:unnamed protein product [Sphagnum troendelagicum]|uniref:Uncharacterized protein n=1 Tax=Sphagnum troendelagicum TaxID=128251 RepID=A0ABP0U8C3_9BRYO
MVCGWKAIFFYKWDMKTIAQLRDSEAGNSESFQVVLCQELCPKVSQHQLKLMRLIVGVEPRSRNRWAAAEDSPQINLLGCQPVSVPTPWFSPSMVAGAVAGVGLASSAAMFPFEVARKWLMAGARAGRKITPRNIQCANM